VGATLARNLAPGGRLLVFGALSSHRQTDPSAFEMPVFAPRLIYGSATIQGWFHFHWLEVTPLADCVSVVQSVLERLASGALKLPPAAIYQPSQIKDALRGIPESSSAGGRSSIARARVAAILLWNGLVDLISSHGARVFYPVKDTSSLVSANSPAASNIRSSAWRPPDSRSTGRLIGASKQDQKRGCRIDY
jgi:hypothetical protein